MRHSNPEFAEIAKHGTILQTEVGSGVHGLAIDGQGDRDEMGICVEPPEFVVGLRRFEQYVFRTAAERTGIADARSEPGDLDLVTYSARKWMRLALRGNAAAELEARLEVLTRTADLPEHPDKVRANRWLIETYQAKWIRDRWMP